MGRLLTCLILQPFIMQVLSSKGSSKTSNFKTEGINGDRTCIIKGCNIKHVNRRGQPVNTLSLCNIFKSLSLKDKNDYLNKGKACRTCTTPGHISKNCKSSNTCQFKLPDGKLCNSKDHHTLLHPDGTTSGQKGGQKKPGSNRKVDTYQTESVPSKAATEVPPTSCHNTSSVPATATPASLPPPESAGQDSTECNSIRSFAATPSECFLADQLESRDQMKLTNCGTVTVKGTPEQHV